MIHGESRRFHIVTRMREELLQTFKETADEVRELRLEDRDALVHIGVSLEEALGVAQEEAPDLERLLELCLESLQGIYQDASKSPPSLLDAVSCALDASGRYLHADGAREREGILQRAMGEIQEAMRHDLLGKASGASAGDLPPENDVEPTLDDIAALMVQTEPTDHGNLARIRDALKEIAERESTPAAARDMLKRVSQMVSNLVDGEVAQPGEAFAEAGRMLEDAVKAATGTAAVAPAGQEDKNLFLPNDADPDLLGEFLVECSEYVQDAEAALLSLETDPEDMDAVNRVFRAFHTIKGTSAFLGLNVISELAHRAESLLSRMRDGEISCTGNYADLALRSVDMLKEFLQAVQDAMGGEDVDKPDGLDELMSSLDNPEAAGVTIGTDVQTDEAPRIGDILVAEGKASREDIEVAALDKGSQPLGLAVLRSGSASLPDVAKALRTQQRLKKAGRAIESSVRVRTDRLDKLIEMVGELVIAHSMVSQDETLICGEHHQLLKKVTHTGKIVRELQDLSMSMRMVPLKATFQKMARLVRDLANKSGKAVDFQTEGEETEIDRNMVDVINDPLVHLVRNAVDHGIEPPRIRKENGKAGAGTIRLSAYHAGGSVVVEIMDDGKGLDRGKLLEKALSRGLIESDKGISDAEVFNLIFKPGFSTVDRVSEVSGRGVGMDVVKKGIEALRGRIEIVSRKNEGCTFIMRLPLTLAITDGMLVRIGEQRFILPTTSISMTFRPDRRAVHTVGGKGELVMFQGSSVPLLRLYRLLRIKAAVEDPCAGLLVIVEDGEKRCALLVDELLGQQQVVAKPLGKGIGKVRGVSGGAILGDGRVGLIFDSKEILNLAREAEVGGDGYGSVSVMGGAV